MDRYNNTRPRWSGVWNKNEGNPGFEGTREAFGSQQAMQGLLAKPLAAFDDGGPLQLKCADIKPALGREFKIKNLWLDSGVTEHGKVNWTVAWTTSPYMPDGVTTVWKTCIALFGICILAWGISNVHASPFWLICACACPLSHNTMS